MTDSAQRIANFRKMAADDPNNELGHFSLGRALLDAGQFDEAAKAFEKVISLKPELGKAYQFLATALLNLNRRDDAIARLTEGVKAADARGDLMPRDEMVRMLKDLGAPTPELQTKAAPMPVGEGEVHCARCGRVMPKMPSPPFRNAQGKLIHDHICAACWREWIGMGTKVINELRLPMNDPQAQKVWEQHMMEFLNLGSL